MKDTDWIKMMEHMQEIRLFARINVRRKRQSEEFSAEALDFLSRVALAEEPLTPLMLSRQTGLTKPMISKLIEDMSRKGYLEKRRDSSDKRSYFLKTTKEGHEELQKTYQYYLEPAYEMRRNLGGVRFTELMALVREANNGAQQGGKQDGVL